MQKITTFYSNRLAATLVKKSVLLAFGGTNSIAGGDQTMFVDRVEVIDTTGITVDAGLVNANFSFPNDSPYFYQYLDGNTDPLLGWTFSAGCGIATNLSAFNVPSTPDGNAVAFLQSGPCNFYQYMQLYPGKYKVRFLAAQRADIQNNDGYVNIDGVRVMYLHPQAGMGFQTYTTDEFTV